MTHQCEDFSEIRRRDEIYYLEEDNIRGYYHCYNRPNIGRKLIGFAMKYCPYCGVKL